MASIVESVVSYYNELLKTRRDPVVETWPFMSSPMPLLLTLAAYLAFVLKIGPKFMEKRPAYKLKNLVILYNAFQVLFSIYLTSFSFRFDVIGHTMVNSCTEDTKEDPELRALISFGGWWYFMAKMSELLDTVFFVLRKKYNQVSFLHVYHHTFMAFFSWIFIKFLPGEQAIIIGLLNSTVHIFMYFYYLLAALGPEYKKYLWWKKYMTRMQLVQFLLMLVYLTYTLVQDCNMPKALTYFMLPQLGFFIYLFTDFYRKSYDKSKKA